jgi:site-specific DNA recombinase
MVELVALRKTNEVAAYVRASMDRKGDRWTVDTQLRKIRALAEAKDWTVVEVYEDNAVSATKKRRAGTRWAEMLDDARAVGSRWWSPWTWTGCCGARRTSTR